MDDLDRFDWHLLELLQTDSRQTGKQLSEQVGLSPAACLRRIQRLRQNGAIERDVAVLSPKLAAPSVKVIVLLTLARDAPDRVDLLRRQMLALPQVKRLYHVTGEADFAMTVVCRTMEEYAAFTEEHFYEPHIKRFESLVVLRDWRRDIEN
ncbi:MAG: Lrp/AsnC family transcriptional regulator [Stappiaceae bacterium]